MAPPTEINQTKLLLVEGADSYWFFIWACLALGVKDVQVLDFGGITDLTLCLRTLSVLPQYNKVTTIVIARDAEKDPLSAVKSVKSSLKKVSLPVPNDSFKFAGNSPRVAFMILPGFETGDNIPQILPTGTLEDLCLEIVKDRSSFACVNSYIECLKKTGCQISRLHKTKLHSYLSGNNGFVGLKIGEAAKVGAWDWAHIRFQQFKDIITSM